MNSDMVKPEKFGHLHLVYHFTVPLKKKKQVINYNMLSFKRRLQNIQVICYEVCKCPVLVMFGY